MITWVHHSREAPCPPWAAVTGGSTCVGNTFSARLHECASGGLPDHTTYKHSAY